MSIFIHRKSAIWLRRMLVTTALTTTVFAGCVARAQDVPLPADAAPPAEDAQDGEIVVTASRTAQN